MDPPPTPQEERCVDLLKKHLSVYPDAEDSAWLTDATLLRFARARDSKVVKALPMLEACIRWRKEAKPYLLRADDVKEIMQLGAFFMCGTCVSGRPVMYMTLGARNPFPAFMRTNLIVYLLEETARQGHEKLTWIFDWSKFGERTKDEESRKARKEAMKILQDYYPERLGALYMVDTPWFFSFLLTIITPFLDSRTRKKIFTKVPRAQLTQYVSQDQLAIPLGGLMKPPHWSEEQAAEALEARNHQIESSQSGSSYHSKL